VEVGRYEGDQHRALALARRVLRRTSRRRWRRRPLGATARDFLAEPADRAGVPIGEAWTLVDRLYADRDVASAEPALRVPGLEPDPRAVASLLRPPEMRGRPGVRSGTGADPLDCDRDCEWSVKACRAPQAWALVPPPGGTGKGAGIVVGHPDTGYTEHTEIWSLENNRILADEGRDFLDADADPADPLSGPNGGHGTKTASVIMSGEGPRNGATFVSGMAPLAKLMPLRLTDSVVLLSSSTLTEAIHYAADRDCHIVSISLSAVFKSNALHRAIRSAVDRGVIVLAAAVNVWPWVVYPARFPEVIAVAATNCQAGIWDKSATGSTIDVAAPGQSVWVAQPGDTGHDDDRVAPGSGTSYAVATTAGACALWLAFHNRERLIERYGIDRLAAIFKEALIHHGVDVPPTGWDPERFGAGIVNVEKLLQARLPDTPPAAAAARLRHAAEPPPPSTVMDELVGYFPDDDPARVRRGLLRFLNTTERELPTVLERHGHELLFRSRSILPSVRPWPRRPREPPVCVRRPTHGSSRWRQRRRAPRPKAAARSARDRTRRRKR
jgi:serine protease